MGHLPDTRYSLLIRLGDPQDRDAWNEFVAIYRYAVLGYCRSRGLQDSDAEEVLQNVLMVVHEKISDWKPTGRSHSFRVWLLRTAHRQCLRAIRQRCFRLARNDSSTSLDKIADDFESSEQDIDWQRWAFQWAAQQVQAEINPAMWQAFYLTAVQQIPIAAAAEQLAISIGTVYTHRCRVMQKIRARVELLSRGE